MDFFTKLEIAGLTLLEQFQLLKGRKPKSDTPVVLAPLIERLNLPAMPSRLELLRSGDTPEQFVAHVISPTYLQGMMGKRGVVSRRVVNAIINHYGVAPIPGYLKSTAYDPRFATKRNRNKMLVVAAA